MASLAWPLCICLMVLAMFAIAAWRFPAQVGGLISRITKIGAGGVTANPAPSAVTQEVKDLSKPEQAEELLKVFDNQLLRQQEDTLREWYLKDVNNPADRERILIRHFAWFCIVFAFEVTYNSVWGSQLRALQVLNESGANGLPEADLNFWYEIAKAGFPARYTNYSFQNWLTYLQGNYLVHVGAVHQIYITPLGNEFLVYLVRNKYSMNKDG